ncbi:hypothetical protein [Brevibacillus reuszeri]|uniref:hypothetical protein n=1 Tax=Brevibacillus reuszeri TaxID=54915 RepID=UPI0028A1F87B|nr:hypothetical protein [Brevibacillus reuszeri]
MYRVSDGIIINNVWLLIIPFLLGTIGFTCLLLGLFKQKKWNLIVAGICFILLFSYFLFGHLILTPVS